MRSSEQAIARDNEARGIEAHEFITLTENEFVRVHFAEDGWKRENGFLERRQRQEPVSVDRRHSGDGQRHGHVPA